MALRFSVPPEPWHDQRPHLRLVVSRRRLRPWGRLFAFMTLPPVLALLLIAVPAAMTLTAGPPVSNVIRSYTDLRLPELPSLPKTTFVYDRNGKLITSLHAGINRTPVPLSKVSKNLRDAVIAVEDQNFYENGAIDPEAIARAAVVNIRSGRIEQGGSTITQQFVKRMFTGNEKTLARKIREAILATKLSRRTTKDQILQAYLNSVYFGNGAYGAQAAAKTYFGTGADKLTIPQAALLAALVRAPATYDPVAHPDRALARRNLALDLMAEQRYITREEAATFAAEHLGLRPAEPDARMPAAYFMDYVRRELQERFGVEETFTGGLRVTATLDRRVQRAAERAVAKRLEKKSDPAAALVAIDVRTGEVMALVGGRNFRKTKFNLAIQAHRQTGSAFKTFTLVEALRQRIDPKAQMRGPRELLIEDKRCFDPAKKRPWTVSNYGGQSAGTMSILEATANSVNTIFAQLVVDVGPASVARTARRMGIASNLQPVCSITLGSQGVTPLEMTNAYATLATGGVHYGPEAIREVRATDGELRFRHEPKGKRVLSRQVARVTTQALRGVIDHGTGVRAGIGRPAAGKTGTAQNHQDAWFCGYTRQLAACVWMGYPKTEDRPMRNVAGVARVTGGSLPAMIWHDFMVRAHKGMKVQGFRAASFEGLDEKPERIASFPSREENETTDE